MEAPPAVVGAPALLSLTILAVALVRAASRHRSYFKELASSFLATCGKREDHKALLVVRQRLLQEKVERVYLVHVILAIVFVPRTLATLRGRPWPFNTELAAPEHRLFASIEHLYLALVALCPGMVTLRSMDALCSVLMLISSAMLSPLICKEANVPTQLSSNSMYLTCICGARRTSGRPWFYVLSVANFVSAWGSFGEVFIEVSWQGAAGTAVRAYLMIYLLLLAGAHAWERNAEGLMLQKLQSEDAKQLLAAASALLRGCCDVVVELDSRGAVLGRAEDLGSYLLRGSALWGMPLTELLAHEEEREQLAERLFRPPEEGRSVAESMPISLRDGNNNMLRVELLWFSLYRFGQELAFMAGFREFAEAAAPPVAAMPVLASTAALAGGSCSESASSASSSLELAVAVLDGTVPSFPIKELSVGFCARIGQLPLAEPLIKHLSHPEAFYRWLCRELARSQYGWELTCTKVTFKLPHGRVEAICSLQQGRDLQLERNVDCVRLYFTSVRVKRHRHKNLIASCPRPTVSI